MSTLGFVRFFKSVTIDPVLLAKNSQYMKEEQLFAISDS